MGSVTDYNSSMKLSPKMYGWLFSCHSFMHNLALIVPSFLFVCYLAYQSKKSYIKLWHGPSYIMISYYACLWIVSLLNLAWSSLQAWECNTEKEITWNMLSLFTTSGMLLMEVSLLAFLLQGNYASGSEALTRTFLFSGSIVGIDLLLKAIYIFGFGVPIFINSSEQTYPLKWALWAVHKLFLTAVYGLVLFMYHSKWRERLPARPAFYKYTTFMFCLNALSLFSCGLTGSGAAFGFWLNNLASICYHAIYLPLLYVTFLSDFFQEDDMRLENVYYSEMKDAGFFDADWE